MIISSYNNLTYQNSTRFRQACYYEIGQGVMSFFCDDGPVKHGFEKRDGQLDMAMEIVDAIFQKKHLAVEAGVGIGKSFAYLVPLLLYNKTFKKPVIIATSTIALQEQLLNDITRLQGLLGIAPEVVFAKGQTHFVCYERARSYLYKTKAEMAEVIKQGLENNCYDRKSFPAEIPQHIWKQINIQKYGKKTCEHCCCSCGYRKMRNALLQTNGIILCNQDFLTSHLLNLRRGRDGLITYNAELVVIDEAHNLEEKVRNATTSRFSKSMIVTKLQEAIKSLPPIEKVFAEEKAIKTFAIVDEFFACLEKQITEQIKEAKHNADNAERFFFKEDETVLALLEDMVNQIDDIAVSINIYSSFGSRYRRDSHVTEDLCFLAEDLQEFCDGSYDILRWIERHGREIEILACPKNTNRIIHSNFFAGAVQTILTSATLTCSSKKQEDQYAYFVNNTGFPNDKNAVLSEPKPSPYPYDEHAMIYCCDDLPHPTKEHDKFVEEAVERIAKILKISEGKALILFTSKSDMEEVYKRLKKKKLPYKILIQQPGSSQDKVMKEFRSNVNSVLLGTGAYWEGISIEGKSLSNLIVFRLPFPVPDPIIDYKTSIADDPVMDVLVPEMITKLKQGIGRLIRNYTDTGIVSIIDPRLSKERSTPYREITFDSLPIKNITNSLSELTKFYHHLRSKE